MIRIAFDVANLPVTQRNLDATTAGTHVTGGFLDFYITDLSIGLAGRVQHG
jgi:hypothetical protein